MSSTREDYLNKVKAKLDEWNAEIGVLEARLDQVKADARIQYQKQLEDARKRRDELKQKLDQVSSSGEEAWGELKSGLDLAWDALSDAVKSAKSKIDS